MELCDKVAVITGSARGIGRAIAVQLLDSGARVCLSNVDKVKGENTLNELQERFGKLKVCYFPCDVTKEEEVKNLFDKTENYFKVDCVDILVNNAGVNVNLGWRKCMDVNMMAVLNVTMIALERMNRAGKPCQIINNSSIAGLAVGVPAGFDEKLTPYAVAKLGVVAMTRSLALTSNNISHKAFCPDGTDTDLVAEACKGLDPKQMEEYQKMTGGLMTPEFVAEGFFKLLTRGSNGDVMLIQKNCPYILIPADCNKPMVLMMSRLAKIIGKLTSTDLVSGAHLILVIVLGILILCALLVTIFS